MWTGRLEFDLLNRYRWSVATVEIVVRLNTITLWCARRSLAVLDRDQFSHWLGQPDGTLDGDEVTWSTVGGRTFMTIDGSIPYVVPDVLLGYLRAVL